SRGSDSCAPLPASGAEAQGEGSGRSPRFSTGLDGALGRPRPAASSSPGASRGRREPLSRVYVRAHGPGTDPGAHGARPVSPGQGRPSSVGEGLPCFRTRPRPFWVLRPAACDDNLRRASIKAPIEDTRGRSPHGKSENRGGVMRTAIRASLVVGLLCWLLAAPPPANAESGSCGNRPGDADQVAAVRAMADAQCDCASTPDHDTYVNCVDEVAAAAVQNGALRPACAGMVTSCAAQSTCGKPGFVTCCRTAADGDTRCSIKHSADACKPPPGGTACVGSVPSCCDACSAGGCGPSGSTTTTAPPTTTTTSTSSTTTTTLPLCAPIVTGQPISGTYQTTSLGPTDPTAVKVCTTNASINRFAICTSDADCGGATGTCAQTPWVDAGGVTQPTPTATTTFTVTAGSPPTCEHTVCIQCGAIGKCADIQGGCDNCGGATDPACTPTSTNVNCPFGDECCQSPGFV